MCAMSTMMISKYLYVESCDASQPLSAPHPLGSIRCTHMMHTSPVSSQDSQPLFRTQGKTPARLRSDPKTLHVGQPDLSKQPRHRATACSVILAYTSSVYYIQNAHAGNTLMYLVHPVGVEHATAPQLAPGALLGHGAQIPGRLQLRDALVHGLPVHNALQTPRACHPFCIPYTNQGPAYG